MGCAVDIFYVTRRAKSFGSRPLSSVWDSTPDPCRPPVCVVVGVCGWCVPVDRVGGYSGGVTPGPIPNPEAKPTCADGTAPGRVWESRSLPANNLFVWSVVSADSLLWGLAGTTLHAFLGLVLRRCSFEGPASPTID